LELANELARMCHAFIIEPSNFWLDVVEILLEQASEQLDVMPPSFRMIWSLVSNEEPRLKEKLPDMPEQSNCQLHYKRNGVGKELKPALFAQTFQHRNSPR